VRIIASVVDNLSTNFGHLALHTSSDQLEGPEERCNSSSGVWDGAPAKIEFGAF